MTNARENRPNFKSVCAILWGMSAHKQPITQAFLDLDLSPFIQEHQLPDAYAGTAKQWFGELTQSIVDKQKETQQPIVVGINGSQGSGKSTLAGFLVYALKEAYGLSAVALSLDDFYLGKADRNQLAKDVHPLLATRGVPGTHETQLAIDTIQALKTKTLPVAVPRFNKAIDDRAEKAEMIDYPVDVIIFEGWCVGSEAQSEESLTAVVNALEQECDADGKWRTYVNQALASDYQVLFKLVDLLVMFKAPSFDCVYAWRLEQEEKLFAKTGGGKQVMSPEEIARFVQFYQRITEHTLITLPPRAHYLYTLDSQRKIMQLSRKPFKVNAMQNTQWLIFTDMDGTLLDHHDYSFAPAEPMLKTMAAEGIPVMPITSKTQAELETLRKALDNQHPFIIENGAAVLIPQGYFDAQPEGTRLIGDYWVKSFVEPREHWQDLIEKVSGHYQGQFTTFAEAGIEGIIEMTGLDKQAATESSQRQYGEPIQWRGEADAKQSMLAELTRLGANILEGGRFIHVSGKSDKGVALQWLRDVFAAQMADKTVKTLALGDSQNDVAMLEAADCAVIVKSPVKAPPTVNRAQNLLLTNETGPAGWAEGVQYFTKIAPQ